MRYLRFIADNELNKATTQTRTWNCLPCVFVQNFGIVHLFHSFRSLSVLIVKSAGAKSGTLTSSYNCRTTIVGFFHYFFNHNWPREIIWHATATQKIIYFAPELIKIQRFTSLMMIKRFDTFQPQPKSKLWSDKLIANNRFVYFSNLILVFLISSLM